jgi:hypothetical protein
VRLQAAGHGVHRLVHAVDHDYKARSLRLAAVAAIAASALVYAGNAPAAYNPELVALQWNRSLGGSANIWFILGFGSGYVRDIDATGTLALYSPRGYTVNLGQAPGTRLGWASALIRVPFLPLGFQSVDGAVTTDDPANHLTNTCSPGRHEAVWLIELKTAGGPLRLPIYVDRVTTGPEAAYASARMLVCFASPYVPPPQGTEGGMTVGAAEFLVSGVFKNPRRKGAYAWNALFTPYKPGTADLNPALTTQSTTYVRLPLQLTVTAKRQRLGTRTFAIVTACVREAGKALRGIPVAVIYRPTVRRTRTVITRRTNARGCAIFRFRVWRSGIGLAEFRLQLRQASGCAPILAATCSIAWIAPALGPAPRFRVRR